LPQHATLADIGSGAGLPIIPCLVVRPDLGANLFESSKKKCVFLKEALRTVQRVNQATVLNRRFESAAAPEVQFVTCRALDKFDELLPAMIAWAPRDATFLLFVGDALRVQIKEKLTNTQVERVPLSEKRFLVIGRR
jgi:16S rRNA (guanine527-N7)-methyltransferase